MKFKDNVQYNLGRGASTTIIILHCQKIYSITTYVCLFLTVLPYMSVYFLARLCVYVYDVHIGMPKFQVFMHVRLSSSMEA